MSWWRLLYIFPLLCTIPIKADKIIRDKGEFPSDVVVVEETYDNIVYYFKADTNRTRQSMDRKLVKRIVRDNTPQEYLAAEDLFRSGNYQQAISIYQKAAELQEWTWQYCQFHIAECYRENKDWRKAISYYQKLTKNPEKKYVYLPQAFFYQGMCFFYKNNYRQAVADLEQAKKLYEKLEQQDMALNAVFYQALSYEKAKKYSPAQKGYEEVMRDRKADKVLAERASVRIAFCLLGQKQYQEARPKFMQFITDPKVLEKSVLRTAYLGLGDCHFFSGGGEREERVKQALFCYLRVVTLYRDGSEETEYAYKQAITCFNNLANASNDYRQRARQLELQRQKQFD